MPRSGRPNRLDNVILDSARQEDAEDRRRDLRSRGQATRREIARGVALPTTTSGLSPLTPFFQPLQPPWPLQSFWPLQACLSVLQLPWPLHAFWPLQSCLAGAAAGSVDAALGAAAVEDD